MIPALAIVSKPSASLLSKVSAGWSDVPSRSRTVALYSAIVSWRTGTVPTSPLNFPGFGGDVPPPPEEPEGPEGPAGETGAILPTQAEARHRTAVRNDVL